MDFNEKLDFLMKLTEIKNSDLAMYTSLDSSYISRLRRGKRSLPKSEDFIRPMAKYFNKHITKEYQKKAIMDELKNSRVSINSNKDMSQIIYEWLKDKKIEESEVVGDFLDDFSNFQFKKPNSWQNDVKNIKTHKDKVKIYKGIEGKREGVLDFLSIVIEKKEPQTLLLFSDEDMEWLTGDDLFIEKWKELMEQVILKGNKIKIIHNVNRNLYEMLASIKEWMPLYMTGAIEPYYYPRKRDGIFKRTIFVAPNTVALTAAGVGDMEDSTINYLVQNMKAVKGVETEFYNYLKLCKPLMKIFNEKNRKEYLETLAEFENEEGDVILNTNAVSIRTLPLSTAEKIMIRNNYSEKSKTLEYARKRNEVFERNIKKWKFTDIVTLPKIEDVYSDNVIINFSNLLGIPPVTYKKDEFIEHLKNILKISRKYKNYNLILKTEKSDKELSLYCKEDVGIIASKKEPPFMILAINESNMRAAFWDFLKEETERIDNLKEDTYEKLNSYIEKILLLQKEESR